MARQLFLIGGIARPTNVDTTPLPGGIQNLIDTYLSNPTLQSKMSLDDYLGYSNLQTQPTTEQIIQSSVAPTVQTPVVKKPILPIPESSGDGTPPPPGRGITAGINLDYGYTGPGGAFNLDDIGEGTVADEDYTLGMRARDAFSGIMSSPVVKYNPMNPMFLFNVAKAGADEIRERNRIAEEKRIQEILEEEKRRLSTRIPGGDSGGDYSQAPGRASAAAQEQSNRDAARGKF